MDIFNFRACAQNEYFIEIQELVLDFEIAEKLGMQLLEYRKILKKYNAYYSEKCDEYFFSELKDVKKCVNYLNKKYSVMLKLLE